MTLAFAAFFLAATAALSAGDPAPFFFGAVGNPEAAGSTRFDLARLVGPRAAGRSPAKAVLVSFSDGAKASRKELAALEALYAQYKSRGLRVVTLTADPARVLRARRVTYPVVEDSGGAIGVRYLGPNPRFPAAVIIDRYGKVVSLRQGYRTDPGVLLRSEIESALR